MLSPALPACTHHSLTTLTVTRPLSPHASTQSTAFVPCTLLGAAAGAAVVYSIEERDIGAVRKKLLPKLTRRVSEARGEVAAVAADVRREAQRAHRHHERALRQLQREGERLAPALEEAAAEAERALAPIVRREYERGRREVQRSLRELEEAAAAVGDDGGRRGGRGGRWEQGAQSDRALVRRFAARSDTEDSG